MKLNIVMSVKTKLLKLIIEAFTSFKLKVYTSNVYYILNGMSHGVLTLLLHNILSDAKTLLPLRYYYWKKNLTCRNFVYTLN